MVTSEKVTRKAGAVPVGLCVNQSVSSLRYKDGNLICQAADPGKYRIESKYGVHTLEINR